LNTFQVTVVPQDGEDWHCQSARLRQDVTQPLNVGGMAKADVSDHRGRGLCGRLLFVQTDRTTCAKVAKPVS